MNLLIQTIGRSWSLHFLLAFKWNHQGFPLPFYLSSGKFSKDRANRTKQCYCLWTTGPENRKANSRAHLQPHCTVCVLYGHEACEFLPTCIFSLFQHRSAERLVKGRFFKMLGELSWVVQWKSDFFSLQFIPSQLVISFTEGIEMSLGFHIWPEVLL